MAQPLPLPLIAELPKEPTLLGIAGLPPVAHKRNLHMAFDIKIGSRPEEHASRPHAPEILPPDATSITHRWDTVFIWNFICLFTSLKADVEELEVIADMETAILSSGYNKTLHAILINFVNRLRPKRNTSQKVISSTLYTLICELIVAPDRSVWYQKDIRRNVLPFGSDMDIFAFEWKDKLTVVRQLVDWQLTLSQDIRRVLDSAHGVVRGGHRKREDEPVPQIQQTREYFEYKPTGLDIWRRRYWVLGDSYRIYLSNNPWRTACIWQCIALNRNDFLHVLQCLKDFSPPQNGNRRTRPQADMDDLINALEKTQLPELDAETQRRALLKKKLAEKQRARELLAARTELRDTRTRIKVNKVDYVYDPGSDREDGIIYDDGEEIDELDDDEYEDVPEPNEPVNGDSSRRNAEEDEDYSQADDTPNENSAPATKVKSTKDRQSNGTSSSTRRSGRQSLKRPLHEESSAPRGERRSARRSTITSTQPENDGEDSDYRPMKRSRMSSVGSSMAESSGSGPALVSAAVASMSINGAAGGSSGVKSSSLLRPGEKIQEAVVGKKKSKFWFYAVEEISTQQTPETTSSIEGDQRNNAAAAGISRHVSTPAAEASELASQIAEDTTAIGEGDSDDKNVAVAMDELKASPDAGEPAALSIKSAESPRIPPVEEEGMGLPWAVGIRNAVHSAQPTSS